MIFVDKKSKLKILLSPQVQQYMSAKLEISNNENSIAQLVKLQVAVPGVQGRALHASMNFFSQCNALSN